MKLRNKTIYIIFLVTLMLSIPGSVMAADSEPDVVLQAAYDGSAIRLSPKNVVLSNEGAISPGDAYASNLLFQNHTGQVLEFSLRDIVNVTENQKESRYILDGLDVRIIIEGRTAFSGTYLNAIGFSSEWIRVAADGELPIQVIYEMPGERDNSYQGLSFSLHYRFAVQTLDSGQETTMETETGTSAAELPTETTSETNSETSSETPGKPSVFGVQTGDTFSRIFYLVIAAIAAIAVFLLGTRDRKMRR